MTKEEIKYVISDELGESLDVVSPLLSVKKIKISKLENKTINIAHARFKFDTTNEILKCYICRKYTGEIPSNWVLYKNYDVLDGVYYKYLFNEETLEPYCDIYDFSSIVMIEC